jgi:hypothetical protein
LQELSNEFRWEYSKLWFSILNKDKKGMQQHSENLGVGNLYFLLACMVTGRTWETIMSGIQQTKWTNSEVIWILCPVTLALQGCETVSYQREEHKSKVFENKMLRKYMNLVREVRIVGSSIICIVQLMLILLTVLKLRKIRQVA